MPATNKQNKIPTTNYSPIKQKNFSLAFSIAIINMSSVSILTNRQTMVKNDEKLKQERIQRLDQMMFSKHWQITLRVIGITLVTIALFGFIGYSLDQRFDSKPLGLVISIIASFPVSQFIIYKVFKKITQ